jgi:peptidoglycan/LPS O-acetylase OafA/YrhL
MSAIGRVTGCKHLDLLDRARGVAILLVLFYHTLAHVYGYDELPWDGLVRGLPADISFLFVSPGCFCGTAGVAVFFVVSGFCIHVSFQQ